MSLVNKLHRNFASSLAIAVACGLVAGAPEASSQTARVDGTANGGKPNSGKTINDGTAGGAKPAETAKVSGAANGTKSGETAKVRGNSNGIKFGDAAKDGGGAEGTKSGELSKGAGTVDGAKSGELSKGAGTVDGAKSGELAKDAGTVDGAGSDDVSKTDDTVTGAETVTTSGVTAKDALITPLDTAVQDEEFYAGQSRQQIALIQQHEAVQHFDASKHYTKKWDLEMAELELRAAIMYMPDLKIAHRDYCIVALMRGKPLRAFAELLMVINLCNPIPLTMEQQRDLRIEAAQAHYKRGVEQAQKGFWDEAISELLWSRTYLPNDVAIHRSLAFAYASKGDFKLAEQYYQSTFSIDPSDAFARADFAYLLKAKGKTDEAVAEMAKAVKADPDSTALHVDFGWLAESKGDLDKAESEFRAALARSPQYSALWYHLGQLLEKKGQKENAKIAYVTALEKEPSNDDAKTALALLGGPTAVNPPTLPAEPGATQKSGTGDTSQQTRL